MEIDWKELNRRLYMANPFSAYDAEYIASVTEPAAFREWAANLLADKNFDVIEREPPMPSRLYEVVGDVVARGESKWDEFIAHLLSDIDATILDRKEVDWEEFKLRVMQEKHWQTIQAGNTEDTNKYYLQGVRRSGAKVYAEGETWQEVYDRLPDWLKE